MTASRAPLVSVIVPTYQRREAVQGAVASVLAQTFGDFEVIVVDDGSRDGTEAALRRIGPPVRYMWQPNRGAAAARNAGLALARGALVAFLDSDDHWSAEHLSVIVAMLRRHPRAVLASTSPGYRSGGGQAVRQSIAVEAFPAILTRSLAGFVSSTAARRAELEAVGGFDEALAVCEDTDLWLRLALRGPFALLSRRTTAIGATAGSLSAQARASGRQVSAYLDSLRSVASGLEAAGRERPAVQVRGALTAYGALARPAMACPGQLSEDLTRACAGLPMLSQDWGLVLWFLRAGLAVQPPHARLARASAQAAAWPKRDSPTAAILHLYAALLALRSGRLTVIPGLLARASRRGLLAAAAAALQRRLGPSLRVDDHTA